MLREEEKYIFVFTSSYHGYYIEELLRRNEIENSFRKAPRAVGKSCNTALYIKEKDFSKAVELIKKTRIAFQGIYEIIRVDSNIEYRKIEI